jgi:solute carrier family 25 folate transporter 32
MVGVSHGSIQLMVYEELKKAYYVYSHKPPNARLGTPECLCFAAVSKIVAASITYPYQVVRARLQNQHSHYNGTMDVIRQTYRYEGLRGFFKGLAPYMCHVTPNVCIVFLIYELVAGSSV